ncbi:MAG: Mur ligase family protein [Candidatus Nealsonbacteria bacterium]|nr:Mur ligase family protein [Candidatus Nealsonbacteria bacterium]
MKLKELKSKRILILGFGREGRNTFRFLRKLFPKKVLGIADKNEKVDQSCLATELPFMEAKVEKKESSSTKLSNRKIKFYKLHLGENYLKVLNDYDVIIKSPGIPFKIIPRSELRKLTSQTEIFFDNYQGQIIGITGTKGKGTTAAMIYEILKVEGIKAHLIGNIGKPVLNLLPRPTKWGEGGDEARLQRPFSARPDVYVYELSSHQLYDLKKSPHIAVFLNLFADHLDYYRNFKEYADAKANITIHQKKDDYLVYNAQDKIVKEIAKKSKAKKVPIKGEYYELNKVAARAVGRLFKISSKIIEKAIKEFKHLPHRLELVGTFERITFYNDASATIPEATMAAMETLGNKVETIILGGSDKNIDFKNLAKKVLESKIKTVILFPITGKRIWKDIVRQKRKETNRKGRVLNHFFVNNMKDAVKLAYQYTKADKICLLSTACASFSIFKDYKEKGDLFKKYVRKYGCSKKL